MNQNDISNFMNVLNNMDKKQLSNSVNELNKILSDDDKKKIIQMLNNFKSN